MFVVGKLISTPYVVREDCFRFGGANHDANVCCRRCLMKDLYKNALGWSQRTRIKDAGIAIRHSQGRILFYTAGSRNGLKGLDGEGTCQK